MYFRRNRYTWVIAIFYEAMRRYRPRRIPSGVEPLRVGRPIKVGMRTITIWPDYIDLAPLSSDPAPSPGRIWYNAVEKVVKYSDGEKNRVIGLGAGTVFWVSVWLSARRMYQCIPYATWGHSIESLSGYVAPGIQVPFAGVAKDFQAYVDYNTLDDVSYLLVRRNMGEAYIQIEVPASETGLVSTTDTLEFDEGDRLDFVVDLSRSVTGNFDCEYITVSYVPK
jgi:hypothetical protein